jgi:hypothetical protein
VFRSGPSESPPTTRISSALARPRCPSYGRRLSGLAIVAEIAHAHGAMVQVIKDGRRGSVYPKPAALRNPPKAFSEWRLRSL